MAVVVEMQNTGDAAVQSEIVAAIEHALSDFPGEWRVSILGSQGSDQWELKVSGPNGLERTYMLDGKAGEHQPAAIRILVRKMVPPLPRR
jgi:hypothetical protein